MDIQSRSASRAWFISAALVLVTALAMGRMVWDRHEFVLLDDPGYVTLNAQVRSGLSWQTVQWAFDPSTVVVGNYHPLTNLSHALDVQLFGVQHAWAHHLVSLLLHMANSVLLYLVLRRMTGDDWPSALVAALFAWHPLHVESVAWVAERKDVLSALFWILAMWFYASYARGSRAAYAGVFVCLLLGLLSKPMVVTLPFALLLLDVWPLQRLTFSDWGTARFWPTARRLLIEKLPLFGLVALSIPFTLHAQSHAKAVMSVETMPFWVRLINVFSSYNAYLIKAVWPAGLTVPYPLEMRELTYGSLLFGAFGFAVVTYLVLDWGRKYTYLPVGWFWFVGTLLPVIGLVQVGNQSMADRYMYLPMIGLSIIFAWGLQDIARQFAWARSVAPAGALVMLVCMAAVTYRQVGYWRNSVTLTSRNTSMFPEYSHGHAQRAMAHLQQGDTENALRSVDRSIELQPAYDLAWFRRGVIQMQRGELDEAIAAIEKGLELAPQKQDWLVPLGRLYLRTGQTAKAEQQFSQVLELAPNHPPALIGSAAAAKNAGRREQALQRFRTAQSVAGDEPAVAIMIARLLATAAEGETRDPEEAIRLAELACRSAEPTPAYWLDTLAAAYASQGRFDNAVQTAERAREQAIERNEPQKVAVIERHLDLYRRGERLIEPADAIPTQEMIELGSENPLQQLLAGN